MTQTIPASALHTLDKDASLLEIEAAGSWSIGTGKQSQGEVCCGLWETTWGTWRKRLRWEMPERKTQTAMEAGRFCWITSWGWSHQCSLSPHTSAFWECLLKITLLICFTDFCLYIGLLWFCGFFLFLKKNLNVLLISFYIYSAFLLFLFFFSCYSYSLIYVNSLYLALFNFFLLFYTFLFFLPFLPFLHHVC